MDNVDDLYFVIFIISEEYEVVVAYKFSNLFLLTKSFNMVPDTSVY